VSCRFEMGRGFYSSLRNIPIPVTSVMGYASNNKIVFIVQSGLAMDPDISDKEV